MSRLYTCPFCGRQYSIYQEGDYICDCGSRFHHPGVMEPSVKSAGYTAAMPMYIDSSSRSVKRHTRHNRRMRPRKARIKNIDCPLAKASLICAVLSIPFFGIPAIPALLFGFAARMLIASLKNHYKGDGVAIAGIAVATVSLSGWGMWLLIAM